VDASSTPRWQAAASPPQRCTWGGLGLSLTRPPALRKVVLQNAWANAATWRNMTQQQPARVAACPSRQESHGRKGGKDITGVSTCLCSRCDTHLRTIARSTASRHSSRTMNSRGMPCIRYHLPASEGRRYTHPKDSQAKLTVAIVTIVTMHTGREGGLLD
jgi:hypothetical protein